jgi:hypothetical protein
MSQKVDLVNWFFGWLRRNPFFATIIIIATIISAVITFYRLIEPYVKSEGAVEQGQIIGPVQEPAKDNQADSNIAQVDSPSVSQAGIDSVVPPVPVLEKNPLVFYPDNIRDGQVIIINRNTHDTTKGLFGQRFELLAGEYDYTASRKGYLPIDGSFKVPEYKFVFVDFVLE